MSRQTVTWIGSSHCYFLLFCRCFVLILINTCVCWLITENCRDVIYSLLKLSFLEKFMTEYWAKLSKNGTCGKVQSYSMSFQRFYILKFWLYRFLFVFLSLAHIIYIARWSYGWSFTYILKNLRASWQTSDKCGSVWK